MVNGYMDKGPGDRIFKFVVDVIKFLSTLPKVPEAQVIRYQLAKASSSSGANYEEAQAASSKADFANKDEICIKGNERIILLVKNLYCFKIW